VLFANIPFLREKTCFFVRFCPDFSSFFDMLADHFSTPTRTAFKLVFLTKSHFIAEAVSGKRFPRHSADFPTVFRRRSGRNRQDIIGRAFTMPPVPRNETRLLAFFMRRQRVRHLTFSPHLSHTFF